MRLCDYEPPQLLDYETTELATSPLFRPRPYLTAPKFGGGTIRTSFESIARPDGTRRPDASIPLLFLLRVLHYFYEQCDRSSISQYRLHQMSIGKTRSN